MDITIKKNPMNKVSTGGNSPPIIFFNRSPFLLYHTNKIAGVDAINKKYRKNSEICLFVSKWAFAIFLYSIFWKVSKDSDMYKILKRNNYKSV